jgi:hypothetical protein
LGFVAYKIFAKGSVCPTCPVCAQPMAVTPAAVSAAASGGGAAPGSIIDTTGTTVVESVLDDGSMDSTIPMATSSVTTTSPSPSPFAGAPPSSSSSSASTPLGTASLAPDTSPYTAPSAPQTQTTQYGAPGGPIPAASASPGSSGPQTAPQAAQGYTVQPKAAPTPPIILSVGTNQRQAIKKAGS